MKSISGHSTQTSKPTSKSSKKSKCSSCANATSTHSTIYPPGNYQPSISARTSTLPPTQLQRQHHRQTGHHDHPHSNTPHGESNRIPQQPQTTIRSQTTHRTRLHRLPSSHRTQLQTHPLRQVTPSLPSIKSLEILDRQDLNG